MDALYEDIFGRDAVTGNEHVSASHPPPPSLFEPCDECENWNMRCHACMLKALRLGSRHHGGETGPVFLSALEPILFSFDPEVPTAKTRTRGCTCRRICESSISPPPGDFRDYRSKYSSCIQACCPDSVTLVFLDGCDVVSKRDVYRLSTKSSQNVPTIDPILFDVPQPKHLIQTLASQGVCTSKPSILPHISRFGTSRTIYQPSYQRGTAHAVGVWAACFYSFGDILRDWVEWNMSAVRRDGIFEACLGLCRRRQLSWDVD